MVAVYTKGWIGAAFVGPSRGKVEEGPEVVENAMCDSLLAGSPRVIEVVVLLTDLHFCL